MYSHTKLVLIIHQKICGEFKYERARTRVQPRRTPVIVQGYWAVWHGLENENAFGEKGRKQG